ncbi:hypothetical protein QL285_056018 [Trifolium repens]|nr:hypothetical protein QL285_056018 [Trifolium repens]
MSTIEGGAVALLFFLKMVSNLGCLSRSDSEKIPVITNDRRNIVVAEFLKEQVAFFLQMQMQNSKENQVGSLFLTFLRDSLSLYEEA